MARFDYTKGAACYEADNGANIRYAVPNGYASQAALGWAACPADSVTTPRGFRPRHVVCVDANGRSVNVTVATAAAYDAIVEGTTTLTIPVLGEATAAVVVRSKVGERCKGKILKPAEYPAG